MGLKFFKIKKNGGEEPQRTCPVPACVLFARALSRDGQACTAHTLFPGMLLEAQQCSGKALSTQVTVTGPSSRGRKPSSRGSVLTHAARPSTKEGAEGGRSSYPGSPWGVSGEPCCTPHVTGRGHIFRGSRSLGSDQFITPSSSCPAQGRGGLVFSQLPASFQVRNYALCFILFSFVFLNRKIFTNLVFGSSSAWRSQCPI